MSLFTKKDAILQYDKLANNKKILIYIYFKKIFVKEVKNNS